MCVPGLYIGKPEQVSDPLELKLQIIVSYQVGAENLGLLEETQYFSPLTHLFSTAPILIIFNYTFHSMALSKFT